jgi:hypothetical protein
VPNQDFVEEALPSDNLGKIAFPFRRLERRRIYRVHVIPERIVDCRYCIDWTCHDLPPYRFRCVSIAFATIASAAIVLVFSAVSIVDLARTS